MTSASADPTARRSDLAFRMPADSANVSLARSLTAGIAARSGFTIEEVEDLRIAIGEACTLVLEALEVDRDPRVDPPDLRVDYYVGDSEITVSVSVPAADAVPPSEDSIAWQVLTSLTSRAEMRSDQAVFAVHLVLRSTLAPAAPAT